MDVLQTDTERIFLLPVALIFQNESGVEDGSEYVYNSTAAANVNANQSSQGWKKEEVVLTGFQKLEKVGDTIKRELKWAFILHTYGFGCLFLILAFYTFFSILNIRSFISSKPFMSTINGFLCLLGTSRAASLFIDPYNLKEELAIKCNAHANATEHPVTNTTPILYSKIQPPKLHWAVTPNRQNTAHNRPDITSVNKQGKIRYFHDISTLTMRTSVTRKKKKYLPLATEVQQPWKQKKITILTPTTLNMPKLFGQVLWDMGFPSVISAFCLVQLAFLQFTQIRVGLEGLRRKSCLSLIMTAHFLLIIGMDIVVASNDNLMIVKHIVHYIFLTWGVFLCSNFLYSGYKVMSMIRNLPGGLKHRELPDPGYKGIMQLAILSPHSNLAGPMTAALLPTLCAPKIHQQDNSSLSTLGFRSDGNSRILESESIPMLEEMTGSSGDEINLKPLTRGSSFQNQTRNSQKFNQKPKLFLRSATDDMKTEESAHIYNSGQKSPKSNSSKTNSSIKATEFDFNVKPTYGILKHSENLGSTKGNYECKNKIQLKTCFENENFYFSSDKKSAVASNSIPEILVSGPANLENDRDSKGKVKKSEDNRHGDDKSQKTLNKLMNEISEDLSEMQILREEKTGKAEEMVEVHESRRNRSVSEPESETKSLDRRKERVACGGSKVCEGNQKNLCRKELNQSTSETATTSNEAAPLYCAFSETNKFEKSPVRQPNIRGRKKGKSLSWKKKDEDEEEKATQECLLLQENSTDVTLRSVLNHISYVDRGAPISTTSDDDLENVRKTKVEWVLNITYITAMWGLMLCLSNMGKIYSPFGVPAPDRTISPSNSSYLQDARDAEITERRIMFSSWPWMWFQTFCRALELAMGCAMANITRQPAADHRYSRASGFRHRDTFYSI